jgi:hypothetical protein
MTLVLYGPTSATGGPSLAAAALLVGLCAGVCSTAVLGQERAKPQFGNWGVDLGAMDKNRISACLARSACRLASMSRIRTDTL